jgi:hypothetical protein
MREKVEAVLLELESIKVSERNWLLNGSEALKHLWDEIEAIETKLRTLQKACELVDLDDQEIVFFFQFRKCFSICIIINKYLR